MRTFTDDQIEAANVVLNGLFASFDYAAGIAPEVLALMAESGTDNPTDALTIELQRGLTAQKAAAFEGVQDFQASIGHERSESQADPQYAADLFLALDLAMREGGVERIPVSEWAPILEIASQAAVVAIMGGAPVVNSDGTSFDAELAASN